MSEQDDDQWRPEYRIGLYNNATNSVVSASRMYDDIEDIKNLIPHQNADPAKEVTLRLFTSSTKQMISCKVPQSDVSSVLDMLNNCLTKKS